jgi:dephospho-CoA kinase
LQASDEERRHIADAIITNDGDLTHLSSQVEELLRGRLQSLIEDGAH